MATNLDEYFRIEAAELLADLTRGLLNLEKEPERTDLLGQCFRYAHTLKGAARTARRLSIGELAHAIEDTLADHRDTGTPVEREEVTDLLAILDTIRLELGEAAPKTATEEADTRSPAPYMPSEDERLKTVRVELASMEDLFDDISEIAVQLFPLRGGTEILKSALDTTTSATRRVRAAQEDGLGPDSADISFETLTDIHNRLKLAHDDIATSLERVESYLGRARDVVSALRLVPVNTIFDPLELAARDTAEALGKEVIFEVDGGTVRMEVQILSAVRDALLHVIRNAIDHGLEKPLERLAQGKNRAGLVRIDVERKARRVVFRVRDDGRGVNAQAVREAAVRRGIIDAAGAQGLSTAEALRLVFQAGVSTSETITKVSGRGVGLDVVRELATRLRGDVEMHSEEGRGTTLTLEVPITLTSLLVLNVALGGETLLIPLDDVRGTSIVPAADIVDSPGGSQVIHEGRAVPFVALSRVLGRATSTQHRSHSVAVFLQSGERMTAFEVDRVQGVMEVMVKPLPAAAGAPLLVAGAAFDPRGDPLLVLDPRGLVQAAIGMPLDARPTPHERALPILIIDDSLTTRMLEQSILESAGFEVDVAASAEEALEKATERHYGLFVVDIEMPGMNGFEFTARTRVDPLLKQIPIIIVTSLASEADRLRGLELGASAYLVKGGFDQERFVGEVSKLVGGKYA